MPEPRFELYQPKTVEEALDYLAMHRTSVKVLAGGTGILPRLRSGRLRSFCIWSAWARCAACAR